MKLNQFDSEFGRIPPAIKNYILNQPLKSHGESSPIHLGSLGGGTKWRKIEASIVGRHLNNRSQLWAYKWYIIHVKYIFKYIYTFMMSVDPCYFCDPSWTSTKYHLPVGTTRKYPVYTKAHTHTYIYTYFHMHIYPLTSLSWNFLHAPGRASQLSCTNIAFSPYVAWTVFFPLPNVDRWWDLFQSFSNETYLANFTRIPSWESVERTIFLG